LRVNAITRKVRNKDGEGRLPLDISAFIRYLEHSRGKSPETVKAYRSDLILFNQFLTSKRMRVTQVKPAVIQEYIQDLECKPNPRFGRVGLSRATIRRRLMAIRGYFDFLNATMDRKIRDPTYGMKIGGLNNDDCKAVDEATLADLLAGITTPRDKVLVSLFLSSGLRLSELHQLNRDSIDVDQQGDEDGESRILGMGEVIGKRSKKRNFYIDGQTVNELIEYLATREDGHPALFVSDRRQRMSKRSIQDTVARWCRRLGIPPVHVHQFRHSFATRLANASIDSLVLKTLMGHADLRTTNRYFKLYEQTVSRQYHAAMERFRPS
jgi:integrase/recombinase XerC